MCSGNVSLAIPGGPGTQWGSPWSEAVDPRDLLGVLLGKGSCSWPVTAASPVLGTHPQPLCPFSESRKAALRERCCFHGELPVERKKT